MSRPVARVRRSTLVVAPLVTLLTVAACGRGPLEEEQVSTLRLLMHTDFAELDRFNRAWNAALAEPERGVAYDFAVRGEFLPADARLELVVARYTGLDVGGEIAVRDPFTVSARLREADAEVTRFAPPKVALGAATSGQGQIPASYLCGETVLLVRALRVSSGVLGGREQLAAAWHVAVAACP